MAVVGGGISYIRWEFTFSGVTWWPWIGPWGSDLTLYRSCTCKSWSALKNSNIFGNLISSSTQLPSSLDWKPCAIDSILKGYYYITLLKCWNFIWEGSFSGKTANSWLCWQRRWFTWKFLRMNGGYRIHQPLYCTFFFSP